MSNSGRLTRLPIHNTCRHLARLPTLRRPYASVATATVPAPDPHFHDTTSSAPIQRYPPLQPPSHKPADLRRSQLHRQYTSLLRTAPLIIAFQHNNLRANEWTGIRRELAQAMQRVSASQATDNPLPEDPADGVRLQVIAPSVFSAALRTLEFYEPAPAAAHAAHGVHATAQHNATLSHALSRSAYHAGFLHSQTKQGKRMRIKRHAPFATLLSGPIALLSFPSVTPAHLAAALSILAPTPGNSSAFPAPKRKDQPGYYDAPVQTGLQKLMMLGARVEGRVMDGAGVRWVGGIQGGMGGLRAQLVGMLQGAGMGLTGVLEGASKALWVTMESRRVDMAGEGGADAAKDEGTSKQEE